MRTTHSREGFAFIGKHLTLKPPNTHQVRQTLNYVWSFAAPFTIEVLSSHKFLFTVPTEALFQRIMTLGPWNIRNSLLILQPWSPALAINEVELHFCPFWVQVHNLPHQYMTVKNAIKIGKGIEDFLELDNTFSGDLICRQFIRLKIDVNTSKPLVPGFYITRPGMDYHWIAFKYERLDDYCVACGLIGHKKGSCPAPQILVPQEKYDISLKPSTSNGPRLVATVQSEDSDSGLSSAALVGNSPCSIGPSHASFSSSKKPSQLVPHGQDKLTWPTPQTNFSQELAIQHVHSSNMILDFSDLPTAPAHQRAVQASILSPQAATSHHRWKKSIHVQAICQLQDKNQVHHISSKSADSSPPYFSLNDSTCYPLLSAYTHRNIPQFDFSSQDPTSTFLTPLKTNQNTMGFFNKFLSLWAYNNSNPNLFGPPPPFHINSFPSPAHTSLLQPNQTHEPQPTSSAPENPYGPHILSSRRNTFHTHRPSHFMPYSLDHKSYTTSPSKAQPTSPVLAHSQLIPTNTAISHYPASTSPSLITSPETPLSIPSPPEKPPFTYPINVSMVTTPSQPGLSLQGEGKDEMG
jgi:hypothetical protein